MNSIFKLLLGITFLGLSRSLALGKCEVAGEAIVFEETQHDKEYIKIGFCEYDLETQALQPLRCFRPQQLQRFLDSIEKVPGLNSSVWINLRILDFKDRNDLNKKIAEFLKDNNNKEVCPSGLVTSQSSKKKIEDAANYLAELYNRRDGVLSSNDLNLSTPSQIQKHIQK